MSGAVRFQAQPRIVETVRIRGMGETPSSLWYEGQVVGSSIVDGDEIGGVKWTPFIWARVGTARAAHHQTDQK